MENNENFAAEVAENVEQQPTEEVVEQPKMFTQEDMNQAVGRAKARAKAQIRKEYERKYGDLENVLKAGTGKESVEEMTEAFTQFYEGKGIKVEPKPLYTDKDLETLAIADANEIIRFGDADVADEVDRLSEIGVENLSPRERAYFKELATHRQNTERKKELAKIGVTEEEYNSEDFQSFARKFNSDIPITEIFGYYNKNKPKKEFKPMGSMKNTAVNDNGVKDFYSYEEASQFSVEDFNKNPALYEAVKRSMTKW